MANRIKILLSIPEDFSEKFANFINNINAVNSDIEKPIRIEKIYQKPKFAAVPKKKEVTIESKDEK